MSRVTSKLQVTLPKAIAERFHIEPGDEIHWIAAGDSIRVVPAAQTPSPLNRQLALLAFDRATERQRRRQASGVPPAASRGWTREDLYHRGRPR